MQDHESEYFPFDGTMYLGELRIEIDGIGSTRTFIVPSKGTREALGLEKGAEIAVDSLGESINPEGRFEERVEADDETAVVMFAVKEGPHGELEANRVAKPLADE